MQTQIFKAYRSGVAVAEASRRAILFNPPTSPLVTSEKNVKTTGLGNFKGCFHWSYCGWNSLMLLISPLRSTALWWAWKTTLLRTDVWWEPRGLFQPHESRIRILSPARWADPERWLTASKDTRGQLCTFKTSFYLWHTWDVETSLFILPIRATLSPYHPWSGIRRLFDGTQGQEELDSLSWYCLLVPGAVRKNTGGTGSCPIAWKLSDWSPFFLEWGEP